MHSGVLLIDKPEGITSAGVVARVKRALRADKVGHAGTLDPDATGLLVCLINGATRVAPYVVAGTKVYTGAIRLGVRTSTDDLTGEVLSVSERIPEVGAVIAAAQRFVGVIEQVPPQVSAVKVNGVRAYDAQRAGVVCELRARPVQVNRFELTPREAGGNGPPTSYTYRIECGPGTYVRALARDLGEALGCGGAAESIRRERSGGLDVQQGVALATVVGEEAWAAVRDWTELLPGVARVVLPAREAEQLLQGRVATLQQVALPPCGGEAGGPPGLVVYSADDDPDRALGLLRVHDTGARSFEVAVQRRSVR
jgi:tRNA pseudouridine55 synthase